MSAHKDRLIAAAELLGMDPGDLLAKLDPPVDLGPVGPDGEPWGWQGSDDTPPPPEGLCVFAHWSRVHGGVNVEIDAPDGLPLTVIVNDWRAVNIVIGTHDTPADPEPTLSDLI